MIAQNALLVRKYRQRPMPQTDASGHSLPIMAINDDLSSHGFHLQGSCTTHEPQHKLTEESTATYEASCKAAGSEGAIYHDWLLDLHAPWAEKMYFCAKSRARRTRCDARNHRMRFVTRKVGAIT